MTIANPTLGRLSRRLSLTVCLLGMAGLAFVPLRAVEKQGMPDLGQIEQTCLPTATGNLMVWFGHNGYPNLIASGEDEDARDLHTVHLIMTATGARFDWGTRLDTITSGIQKFIRQAGYDAEVEYRGLDYAQPGQSAPQPLTEDWLYGNDDPNKGYVLLFAYCNYHPESDSYTDAIGLGHAVTLVNAEPGLMLIHDPAHDASETGRKIITPTVLTSGNWQDAGGSAPVTGLMLVSGSLLEAPGNSQVMLTGAICITMHPPDPTKPAAPAADPASGSSKTIDGTTPGTSSAPDSAKPAPANPPWWMWIFDLLLKK